MTQQEKWLSGAAVIAGLALWLLVAGPRELLGFDPGNVGMVLLMGSAWLALYATTRMAAGGDDSPGEVSPGEWKARVGVAFMLVGLAYMVMHLPVLSHNDSGAARVGRNLVMLLIAWTILSSVVKSRWQRQVEIDERDRIIESRALGWGYGALVSYLIGLALTLSFSPEDRLQWASHFMIGNLLVLGLMVSCLFDYLARAGLYWRDRH